jgi:DNA invertase Pin-like site-specific DNA recombinase
MEGMIYGYARVSTAAQDESGQVRQLKAAGYESKNIFREKITGTAADRPQLGRLMKKLAPGDVVITPAVDRLSRDTTDLLVIAREMQRAGAGIRPLAEPFLDTTPDFAEIIPWRRGEAGAPPHPRTHDARPGRRQGQGRQIRP